MNIVFIIGANATGKSRFIQQHAERICPDARILNVFDYQTKVRKEQEGKRVSEFDILFQANEELLNDIVSLAKAGENVIVEHTLFKRKRRLPYVDAIRQAADASVSVYVMRPSDERLKENLSFRSIENAFDRIRGDMENVIESPNRAEGFDHIFIVDDGGIREVTDAPDERLCLAARKELEDEKAARIEKEKKAARRKELIRELCAGKPFWHYCSGCGAKQFLTSREAFNAGWDFPGKPGIYETEPDHGFGMLSPRTCPSCTIDKSLYWRMLVHSDNVPLATAKEVTAALQRIAAEPFNLIGEPG